MYSFRNDDEKDRYLEFISNNYTRTPKSKIVVFDELGDEDDGTEYNGVNDLVSFPKTDHTTTQLIGGFPAKTCEFEIYNRSGNINLNGKEVAVYRGLEINGSTIWVPMGIFKAEDADIKTNINKRSISFKGTDRTRLFERKYTTPSHITTSSTLLQFTNAICNRCGVTLKGSLPLASFQLHKLPNVDENTTDRQMLGYIAEINGCIAMIDRDGKFMFKKPAAVAAGVPKTKYKAMSYENTYGPVNTVYLGRAGYEDTYHYPSSLPTGTEEIKWVIKDNPIIDLDRVWWLDSNRVPSQVLGASMVPFEITELIDDYIYDIGDIITVTDKNSNTVDVTVLSIVNTSRIKSTLKAETPTGHEAEKALSGSLREQIKSARLEVDHVNNVINGWVSDGGIITQLQAKAGELETLITDEDTGLQTQFQQLKDSFTLSVINALKRNLLEDSACFAEKSFQYVNATERVAPETGSDISVPSGVYKSFDFRTTTSTGSGIKFSNLIDVSRLKEDTEYTLSFYARRYVHSTEFIENKLVVYEGSELAAADIIRSDIPALTDSWQRFELVFKTNSEPEKLEISFLLQLERNAIEGIDISSIQLEEGSEATDWTQSDSEYATKTQLQVLDGSIVGRIETALDGGVCPSVTLDINGLTVEDGALIVKNENGTQIITSEGIVSDEIKFGKTVYLSNLNNSTAAGYHYSPATSAITTRINGIPELAEFYSGKEWFYPNDGFKMVPVTSVTDEFECKEWHDYIYTFDYIILGTEAHLPVLEFGASSVEDASDSAYFFEIGGQKTVDYKKAGNYYYMNGTAAGSALARTKCKHLIDQTINIGFVYVDIKNLINYTAPPISADFFILISNVNIYRFDGASLEAGAILNSSTDYYFDFKTGAIHCEYLRAGRIEMSFEAWEGSGISLAMRDVIRSEGGLVITANDGSNAMVLECSKLWFNAEQIYYNAVPATLNTASSTVLSTDSTSVPSDIMDYYEAADITLDPLTTYSSGSTTIDEDGNPVGESEEFTLPAAVRFNSNIPEILLGEDESGVDIFGLECMNFAAIKQLNERVKILEGVT